MPDRFRLSQYLLFRFRLIRDGRHGGPKTSWQLAGRAEGRTQGISQGKETLVLRLLRRRLGAVPRKRRRVLPPVTKPSSCADNRGVAGQSARDN